MGRHLRLFSFTDVNEHVHSAGQVASRIEKGRWVWQKGYARTIGPFCHRVYAPDRTSDLEANRHRALIVPHGPAIGPIEFPGTAELGLAQFRPTPPKLCSGFVVVSDAPFGVGRVDGGRQRSEQLAVPSLAPAQGAFLRVQSALLWVRSPER